MLAPDFVEGLSDMALADLRERRHQCEEVEVALSYVRRMAQGRLDLIHAESARRISGEPVPDDLVDQLSTALAHNVTAPGAGRLASVMAPDMESSNLMVDLDSIVGPAQLASPEELGQDDLDALIEALAAYEAAISAQRRALHERIDSIQAEVVRRYKSGEASIDTLLK